MTDNVDISNMAKGAMTGEEAADRDRRWTILAYGNPGVGKTHFGYSMPGPIAFVDTEGKADNIAHKFNDEKDIAMWQPKDFSELLDATGNALDFLEEYRDKTGQRGTLVVDSFGLAWEWAQRRYVQIAYPGKDIDDVEFQSALQSGGQQSDWQAIKEMHNDQLRAPMVNSDFHLCWTATSKEDYGAVLSGDADEPPKKPDGEKHNVYKVSELLHFFEGDGGVPHANLKKSASIRSRFGKMSWPTFDKVNSAIKTIDEAEQDPDPVDVGALESEFDVDIFQGDPDIVYRGGE